MRSFLSDSVYSNMTPLFIGPTVMCVSKEPKVKEMLTTLRSSPQMTLLGMFTCAEKTSAVVLEEHIHLHNLILFWNSNSQFVVINNNRFDIKVHINTETKFIFIICFAPSNRLKRPVLPHF